MKLFLIIGRIACLLAAFYLLAYNAWETIAEFNPSIEFCELADKSNESEEESNELSAKELKWTSKELIKTFRNNAFCKQAGEGINDFFLTIPDALIEVSTPPPEA